jgi:hypothetical protein
MQMLATLPERMVGRKHGGYFGSASPPRLVAQTARLARANSNPDPLAANVVPVPPGVAGSVSVPVSRRIPDITILSGLIGERNKVGAGGYGPEFW